MQTDVFPRYLFSVFSGADAFKDLMVLLLILKRFFKSFGMLLLFLIFSWTLVMLISNDYITIVTHFHAYAIE